MEVGQIKEMERGVMYNGRHLGAAGILMDLGTLLVSVERDGAQMAS